VQQPVDDGTTLFPGQVTADKGPDGNSVMLDAPDGLLVVDSRAARGRMRPSSSPAKTRPRLTE
jgi:hypothetical protein